MYGLYPIGVSGVDRARGMALAARSGWQLGCRDQLGTSFTAHWRVAGAAPCPFTPSLLFRSQLSLALHLADHKCVGIFTFPIRNRREVFCWFDFGFNINRLPS